MKFSNTTPISDEFLRRMTVWVCQQLGVKTKGRGHGLRVIEFRNYSKCRRGTAWSQIGRVIIRIGEETKTHITHRTTLNGQPMSYGSNFSDYQSLTSQQRRELLTNGVLVTEHGDWVKTTETKIVNRYPMHDVKYPGRTVTPAYDLNDRIEAIVHVTAHEVAHLAQYGEGKRRNREARIDAIATTVLEKFRADRSELLAAWEAPAPTKLVKPKRSRAEVNEAKARKMLAAWEAKLKRAKTKVTNYRNKVRRYDRIAATRGKA